MPATIRPVLPSSLISAGVAAGGAVHAEVMFATYGERSSRAAMSVPASVAAAPSTPSAEVTLITSSMSPWPNLSTSSAVALADSDVGSWKPPADRCWVTGTPKIPQPIISSSAATRMRRGAAMAVEAMRWSTGPLLLGYRR